LLFTMLRKNESDVNDQERRVYRFEYCDWDVIVTVPCEVAEMHGIAIFQLNDDAPVYSVSIKREIGENLHLDIAEVFSLLQKQIAYNYAMNILEEHDRIY